MLFKRCTHADKSKCRCAFWYAFDLHYKRYSRSTRTANKQTAGRIEERRRVAILENRDTEDIPELLLSKHITDYLAHTKEHNVTYYKDETVLNHLKAVVGDIPLADVSAFGVESWKQKRSVVVSKSTVNRELNIVRGCFTLAVKWKRITTSPLADVKNFKVDDQRVRVLNDTELQKVLTCPDPFVALVCRTTLECLPRLSEVLGIHRTHVGPGWIEFRRKGGRVTRAVVTDDLRTALLTYSTDDHIFGPINVQDASTRIVCAMKALGVTDASHHTCRHTGVTLMLEHGINPMVIKTLAGWSSLKMLERYGHTRDAELRRAVNENAAYLSSLR